MWNEKCMKREGKRVKLNGEREGGDNSPSLKFNINYQVLIRAVMREPEFI
jgi:hypothetical protein